MKKLATIVAAGVLAAVPTSARLEDGSAREGAVFLFGEDSRVVSAMDWVHGKRDDLLGRIDDVRSGWSQTSDPKRLTYHLSDEQAACVADNRQCHSSYQTLRDNLSQGLEKRGIVDSIKQQYETAKEAVADAYDDLTGGGLLPNDYQRSAMLGARLAEAEATQGNASGMVEEYAAVDASPLGQASASNQPDIAAEYEWQSSSVTAQDPGKLYGMPSEAQVAVSTNGPAEGPRITYTDDGTKWEVYDYQGPGNTGESEGGYHAATSRYAEDTTATYGTIPGGVACVSGDLPHVEASQAVVFPETAKITIPGEALEANLPLPANDFRDLLTAIGRDDRLAVTLAGDGDRIGDLPRSNRMVQKLLEADALLGSLVFDGSRSPFFPRFKIEGLAPGHSHFDGVVFFEIAHKGFEIKAGRIVSKGQSVNVTLVPMKRGNKGEFTPDYAAINGEGFRAEASLTNRVKTIAASMGRLSVDPLLAPAFRVCEGAALARLLSKGNLRPDRLVVGHQGE